ncbi:MAG: T9SS type A sorting domain-containing protein, partial [Bacteroidota bacterium]
YDVNVDFGRSFATGYVVGDNLYMFGGSPSAGGKISYIASYNLVAKKISWNFDFVSEEKPREQMTFLVNNNIYVFGGAFNGVIDKIQRFDIPPQKGEFLNYKLLEKRAGGSAVYSTIHRKGFLIAGYNESSRALRTVEEIIVYGDGSLKITKMPSLQYARYNPMAVDYKGIIAVFGGRDSVSKVVPYVETLLSVQTDIKEDDMPHNFVLYQNYPNPFNPSTIISYKLPAASHVTLKVYDVLGREAATLVNEFQQPGNYNSQFSILNSQLSSGVYFYRLTTPTAAITKKMMLVK